MAARTRRQAETSDSLVLCEIEQIALEGLMAQEAHLQRDLATAMEPITQRYRAVFATIEERLGLDANALQTTHTIDAQTMTVRERNITPLHPIESEPNEEAAD